VNGRDGSFLLKLAHGILLSVLAVER